MKRLLVLGNACLIAALFAATASANVNIKFADPNGGWTYSYQDGVIFDPNDGPRTFVHLDGTWDSFNGLEAWDGSAVGEVGPKPDGDSPAG